jgi:predicted kinase
MAETRGPCRPSWRDSMDGQGLAGLTVYLRCRSPGFREETKSRLVTSFRDLGANEPTGHCGPDSGGWALRGDVADREESLGCGPSRSAGSVSDVWATPRGPSCPLWHLPHPLPIEERDSVQRFLPSFDRDRFGVGVKRVTRGRPAEGHPFQARLARPRRGEGEVLPEAPVRIGRRGSVGRGTRPNRPRVHGQRERSRGSLRRLPAGQMTRSRTRRWPVFYLVIRGPLGVGKSTLAGRLAERFGAAVISIDRLLEEHDLWESGRLGEFLRANSFAVTRAGRLLPRGRPVIIDGNFYWKTQVEDLIARLDFPHCVFTLEAPLEVCIGRDRRRRRSYGPEATRAVYAKTTRFPFGQRIDATQPVEVILREITARVRNTLRSALR